LYRQASCATRNGNATEAEQIYKSWLQKYRNETLRPSVLYGLAWIQLEENKQEEARANFEILVHDYPGDSLSFDSYFRIGEIAYNKEQYGEAAVAYEKALKDKGNLELDKVIYKLGWAQEKTGNIEKALDSFNKLTAEYPESPLASEAYYRQGRILQELKRLAEAAVSYAAVKEGKFFERAVFGEAEVQRLLGNHKTALAGYDKLLQEWPKGEMKIPGMLGRGHAMLAIGANQNAVEAYEQVVRETDTIEAAEALLGVGKAYMAMEKWEDAAKAFLKIDILYGYDELKPQALDHLVKVWEMAGNKEKADKYRKERQQRYPN
jgi:TolA-binding protein